MSDPVEPKLPKTYTAAQLAKILQIRTEDVYRAGKAGNIPGRFVFGGRVRWRAEEVNRWLGVEV